VIAATLLRRLPYRSWLIGGALAVAAVALPVRVAVGLVAAHEYDSGNTGVIATGEVNAISSYIVPTAMARATSSSSPTRARSGT